jgi:hypothetical protein
MVAQQPQLQIQTNQPTPSPQDEALKRNTDCVYFLASPLTCKKVLFFILLTFSLSIKKTLFFLLGILSFRVSDSSVWGIGLGYSGF